MHIVQSQTLVIHKTVNARVTSTPTVLIDVPGNQKSKMVAAKPEVLYISSYIQGSNEIHKAAPTFSGSSNLLVLV